MICHMRNSQSNQPKSCRCSLHISQQVTLLQASSPLPKQRQVQAAVHEGHVRQVAKSANSTKQVRRDALLVAAVGALMQVGIQDGDEDIAVGIWIRSEDMATGALLLVGRCVDKKVTITKFGVSPGSLMLRHTLLCPQGPVSRLCRILLISRQSEWNCLRSCLMSKRIHPCD